MDYGIRDDATFDVTLEGETQVIRWREELVRVLEAYLRKHDGDAQAFAGSRVVQSPAGKTGVGQVIPWSAFVDLAKVWGRNGRTIVE